MGCCWCKPEVLVIASGAPEKTLLVSRGQGGHYHIGDRVDAQYLSGTWYAATLEKDNGDGTFTLSWDDADTADRVKGPDKLRRIAVREAALPSSPDSADFLRSGPRKVTIRVDRDRLLSSAIKPVLTAAPEDLRPGRLRVEYKGEEGEDGEGGGGVTRAFLAHAGGLLADARLGLFLPAPGGHLQLSPLPGFLTPRGSDAGSVQRQPEHWSRFLGRLLGMAVAHECPLGLLLAPSLCKQLLGREPGFDDLQFVPGLSSDGGAGWHRSLRALLAHRAPELVWEADPMLTQLDPLTVDEALLGLEAVMPSRTEQTFESLAAHVGAAASSPTGWEGAADVAACLLREAKTNAQRDLALEKTRDFLEGIVARRTTPTAMPWTSTAGGRPAAAGRRCQVPQVCELPPGLRRALLCLCPALKTVDDSACGVPACEVEELLQRALAADGQEEVGQVLEQQCLDEPVAGVPRDGHSTPCEPPTLERAVSQVYGPGIGEGLSVANVQAFAEAVTCKALTENLQPHLGLITEEFRQVVPQRLKQGLSWQQVQDRISGRRLDPEDFVREWRDKTTYQSCTEADESVRMWWNYVSECTADELVRLFAWCTGFAAIPVTAWKFQIKVIDDTLRCPTINTCMTDDPSAANRGVKMPTIYLPAYDSKSTLAQKMEWAIAGASSLNLH